MLRAQAKAVLFRKPPRMSLLRGGSRQGDSCGLSRVTRYLSGAEGRRSEGVLLCNEKTSGLVEGAERSEG